MGYITKLQLQLGRRGELAGSLIGLMVALVIGVAVTFSVVQSTSSRATTVYSMTNDTFNASATALNKTQFAGFGDKSQYVINIAATHLYNGTDCTSAEFTYGTDYVVLGNGTTPYLNLTNAGNVKRTMGYTCATYTYQDNTYVASAISRTILSLLPLMVAVVLLVACAGMIAA